MRYIQQQDHLRNLWITLVLLATIAFLPVFSVPQAQAQSVVTFSQTDSPAPSGDPGALLTAKLRLSNSNTATGYNFTFSIGSLPSNVQVSNPGTIQVSAAAANPTTSDVAVQISLDTDVAPGSYRFQITANGTATTSGQQNTGNISTFVSFVVNGATATPTPTATRTPTATATTGPTATPGPICVNGRETSDPGDSRESAMLIQVNLPQRHGICRGNDEDWFKFGAIGNKVYSIAVTEMAAGLDLVIELYDPKGKLIVTNDDYYAGPEPTPEDARNIKPRINSFRIPYDGVYTFRVRDVTGTGGPPSDGEYVIGVFAESYGPTPVTVPSECRDLYEEDGLPEEATLITSNELQPAHVLCPVGDADWVKFFGKSGKTYYLYTDTRNYKNENNLNGETEAGADTTMYLFDRDGVSLLQSNDDIEGGGSLDSEIRFAPTVDGFYYAQVKNIGDIGNQFIEYDLALKLCVPVTECGRGPAPADSQSNNGSDSGSGSGSGQATATEASFSTDTTPTDTPTPTTDSTQEAQTATASAEAVNQNLNTMANGRVEGFLNRYFRQVWEQADMPVASQRANRTWVWGPGSRMARGERYVQSGSGQRQVLYFDKARMEINDPNSDRTAKWFVTNGLLVKEMITGQVQIGDNDFTQRDPASIPVAGDANDTSGPTYASFASVASRASEDRTGQVVAEALTRDGKNVAYNGPRRSETRLVYFARQTNHNIPQVFWQYLNSQGLVYTSNRYQTSQLMDWVFALGYPLSEPYWTTVSVNGQQRDVLVQVFERRVLTYSPDNPDGWKVEMGNVGRHYYLWRYNEELPS